MSKFEVDLTNVSEKSANTVSEFPMFSEVSNPQKSSVFVKFLKVLVIFGLIAIIFGSIGGFFYWQNLKKTPQYSLALLVEAARNDDSEQIEKLVDTNAVVDDFMPQITSKAVELYGRGLPADKIAKISKVVGPIMPAVKDRAREELPKLIREKTDKFRNIPFWAIAIGSESFLDISIEGEKATIRSNIPEKELELTLKKNGDLWQVVAVKDERLAQRIAEGIGEEVIAIAQKSGAEELKETGKSLGVKDVTDILKKAEEIFK